MLTDMQIRKAKPRDEPYRLTDGAGLYLHVTPAGGRHWRYRYRINGREKLLSIGPYPEIGLAQAREARDEARGLVRAGEDPSAAKRRQMAMARAADDPTTTFEAIAREWHGLRETAWAQTHAHDVLHSLERCVFPQLGELQIRAITAPTVLEVLRPMEERGAGELARRVRQRMSAVFVYAIASGRAEADPAAIVAGAMAPVRKGRQPAVTSLDKAREILIRLEDMPSHPVTRLAVRLLALTALRPGTLVSTPWQELSDLSPQTPTWIIPAARMKLRLERKDDSRHDFAVPLPRQALEILSLTRAFTGRGPLVFPNSRDPGRPMSENAMGYLLNRAGYRGVHVPHGWRATFSTVMNERFPADRQAIDRMLAHTPENKVEAAYNRADHMERRRELAQIWADLLLEGVPPVRLDGPRK